MSKKEQIRQARLENLETEFNTTLVACLIECAKGRWGLFGQNALADLEDRYWTWPEAKRLREIASDIRSERAITGESNARCNEFLHLCQTRGANVPGEPQLAARLLAEIQTH
jgi:hypothetical protein